MNLLLAIGSRIQHLREKKGITQEQLEEETGINAKYISAIECGQKNATVKTMEKIAEGLDVKLYELFLFPEGLTSEKITKKAIDSLLIKNADIKTLNLCLDFLRKSA
ncbi:MAG: helix-turn-helix transcriptional regulator [Nitrospirae bacterium]|nr:helix-turn-helix transcriptional regulator [Nitrospirota bacterium]